MHVNGINPFEQLKLHDSQTVLNYDKIHFHFLHKLLKVHHRNGTPHYLCYK